MDNVDFAHLPSLMAYHLSGSSLVEGVEPADIDYVLAPIPGRTEYDLVAELQVLGYTQSAENYSSPGQDSFRAMRKEGSKLNLIVVGKQSDYIAWLTASKVLRITQLKDKGQRIALFSAIRSRGTSHTDTAFGTPGAAGLSASPARGWRHSQLLRDAPSPPTSAFSNIPTSVGANRCS